MKKNILIVVLLSIVLITGQNLLAQGPPHPPTDNGHGQQGNQVPGGSGAPIGSGLGILLALGAVYGSKKVYNNRQQQDQKQEEE
jgi:hypothetical protein